MNPIKDWKTTVMGILTLLFTVLGVLYPKFTVENQQLALSTTGDLINYGISIFGGISSLILIFKAVWAKATK